MRILGIAGLLLALALVGYLIVGYLGEAGRAQDALRAVPGGPAGAQSGAPVDLTKSGLEQRLAPTLEMERKRVEGANQVSGQ
jgi:hypothetical protein